MRFSSSLLFLTQSVLSLGLEIAQRDECPASPNMLQYLQQFTYRACPAPIRSQATLPTQVLELVAMGM